MEFLQSSLVAGIFILVTLLLRHVLGRRLPAGCFCALWTVALLRLLHPFRLPTRLSIYNLFEPQAVSSAAAATASNTTVCLEWLPFWLLVVWAAGFLLTIAYLALSYGYLRRRFRGGTAVDRPEIRELRTSFRFRRPVRVCLHPQAETPMTFGILRPTVILPLSFDLDDPNLIRFVLLHEFTHIRRLDCLRKLLFHAVRCLHWFNPMVWLLCWAADADLERACDEAVLSRLPDGRRAYASALLRMAEAPAPSLCSAFGKSRLEERILTIMTYKKRTMTGVILSALVVAATSTAFASDAQTAASAVRKTVPATAVQYSSDTAAMKAIPVSLDAKDADLKLNVSVADTFAFSPVEIAELDHTSTISFTIRDKTAVLKPANRAD